MVRLCVNQDIHKDAEPRMSRQSAYGATSSRSRWHCRHRRRMPIHHATRPAPSSASSSRSMQRKSTTRWFSSDVPCSGTHDCQQMEKPPCASCHLAEDWGADRRMRSIDARGEITTRHSQSVLNARSASAVRRLARRRRSGPRCSAAPRLEQFIQAGCAGCHSGELLGGGSLQRFEVIEDYHPHTVPRATIRA